MNMIVTPSQEGQRLNSADLKLDDLSLSVSRAVVRRPQDYTASIQRAACAYLMTFGDWMDHERARFLLVAIETEERVDGTGANEVRGRDPWGAGKLLIGLVLGGLLAIWLMLVAEKAYGQYRYDVERAVEWAVR